MRTPTDATLHRSKVLWLSSVGADGRPHIAPAWFVWDGEHIVLFSKPRARKIRNLRRRPHAMVALGSAGPHFDVELIEADAELPTASAAEMMPDAFATKYRALMQRADLSMQRFEEVYSQPIVLRPTRYVGYGGHGWS